MHMGTAIAQWLRCCATNGKIAGSIPAGVIGIFHWNKNLPIAVWPWSRLNLKQKWVPGVLLGGKGGRCVRLTTLPPSCVIVMKCGNLNFLEPSGPLQACNGTDLPYLEEIRNYFKVKKRGAGEGWRRSVGQILCFPTFASPRPGKFFSS